jgi:hypothetical protein
MATIPHPHDDPRAWNSITLGGFHFPFPIAVRVELTLERLLDKQESPGADNVTHNHQGFKPGAATVKLQMWDSRDERLRQQRDRRKAHLQVYQELFGFFRPGFPSIPVGVIHPQFTIAKIDKMLVMKVVAPEDAGGGLWMGTIELLEFMPPSERPKGTTEFKVADGALNAQDGSDLAAPQRPSSTVPPPR